MALVSLAPWSSCSWRVPRRTRSALSSSSDRTKLVFSACTASVVAWPREDAAREEKPRTRKSVNRMARTRAVEKKAREVMDTTLNTRKK
ncbi:MAG TPA: hypothetical protein HA252_07095 [Candidatus Diapherotrites archaeon]|uniref:Uncharacterized protein n=1 Tax=Candidatus Iainarchaeum sp. TaxID=3101447 RepID=A0A7J4JHB4_9ARCH|nr:hypothetical protein [Candidatus Diapherotrites archaeon]